MLLPEKPGRPGADAAGRESAAGLARGSGERVLLAGESSAFWVQCYLGIGLAAASGAAVNQILDRSDEPFGRLDARRGGFLLVLGRPAGVFRTRV